MEAEQIMEMLASINANMETLMARMDASHKKMTAWLSDTNDNREETMACQETMETRLEEKKPASMEKKPEVEDAARMPVGEPRNRRREERNLDARRRRKQQGQIQNKDGCLKNLVAARRGTTCRATVAWHKRHIRSTVEQATQRVGWLRKNLQLRQESGKATKDPGSKRPLYPEKRKTTSIDTGWWSLWTAITSGKKRTNLQDPQEDPGTGIHEASKGDSQRVTKKQTLDTVEGQTPSETEEETALA
jgi:hypothetical protein